MQDFPCLVITYYENNALKKQRRSMSVAQKLCEDIVEPVVRSSSNRTTSRTTPVKRSTSPSSSTPSVIPIKNQPTRSIIIQKRKVLSTVGKRDPAGSKVVLNKVKSKETIVRKTFLDTAVNTQVTGPLKCDNDCVTDVRKRDGCICKCNVHKPIRVKSCAKEIQTVNPLNGLNFMIADKACAHCVETNSCGTQFFEKLRGLYRPQVDFPTTTMDKQTMVSAGPRENHCTKHHWPSPEQRYASDHYYGSPKYPTPRRWALNSRYHPVHGPDF